MLEPRSVGLIGGLVLVTLFLAISHGAALEWSGWQQAALVAAGWMLILGSAVWLTRRWLAPALVIAAGALMTVGERVADGLVHSDRDRDVTIGVLLSPVFSFVATVCLIGGVALMVRSILRKRQRAS